MNLVSVLLPFFAIAGLSVSKGAFLVSGFTITSSLLQPVFGALSDRNNRQWLVFTGTLWMAFMLSMIGLTTNYQFLMIIVALGGLGTAAFHPQASAMVATCSPTHKTFIQAIFIASGNIGWALTPLLAVPLVQKFGLTVTPVFIVPGILICIFMWFSTRHIALPVRPKVSGSILSVLKQNRKELTKIMLIVALRSLTYFSLIAFLPIYLLQKGIPLVRGGQMVFLMLFTGSLGGLLGGFIADKVGRKMVIVCSLSLATPFFYLFLISAGWLSVVFLGLAGAFLLATFSITVAAAHQVIRNNAGLASGLTLGFGTGIGGLGVGIMGLITHYLNVSVAIDILIVLPLVAALLGISLTNEKVVSKNI